jgi:hypothetical protein
MTVVQSTDVLGFRCLILSCQEGYRAKLSFKERADHLCTCWTRPRSLRAEAIADAKEFIRRRQKWTKT